MPDPNKSFDIDLTVIPPHLQMKLWVLGLDANTSKVGIAYRSGGFLTGLAYNYGGNLEASVSVRRFSTTLGVNPGNGDVDLGVVYQGFRFGSSASVTRQSFGVGVGYGASLLPYPWELAGPFNSGAAGLQRMTNDISAAPNNPLAWYKLHSNDVTAVGHAITLGQQIGDSAKNPNRFGFGLRLNYTPQTQLTIYGGAILRF